MNKGIEVKYYEILQLKNYNWAIVYFPFSLSDRSSRAIHSRHASRGEAEKALKDFLDDNTFMED